MYKNGIFQGRDIFSLKVKSQGQMSENSNYLLGRVHHQVRPKSISDQQFSVIAQIDRKQD